MEILKNEIKQLYKQRLISYNNLELFLKFPEDKLQFLCAYFMNDLVFLTTHEIETILKVCNDNEQFNKTILQIKKRINNDEDVKIFKKNLIYIFSKLFAYLENIKSKKQKSEIINFLILQIIMPVLEMLQDYPEFPKIKNLLKNFLRTHQS